MLKTMTFKSQFTCRVRSRKHFSKPWFILGSILRHWILQHRPGLSSWQRIPHPPFHLGHRQLREDLTTTCLDSKWPQELSKTNELFIAAPKCFLLLVLFSSPSLTPVFHLFYWSLKTSLCHLPTRSTTKAKPKVSCSKVRENAQLLLCGAGFNF